MSSDSEYQYAKSVDVTRKMMARLIAPRPVAKRNKKVEANSILVRSLLYLITD